ncbi:MAG: hypothetical protein WCO53_06145 [Deltaproteobacteria bacterium]
MKAKRPWKGWPDVLSLSRLHLGVYIAVLTGEKNKLGSQCMDKRLIRSMLLYINNQPY